MVLNPRAIAISRLTVSGLVLIALGLTLRDTSGIVPERIIDLLGYYTLQANFMAFAVWVALAIASARPASPRYRLALEYARAFITANLVLVAVIYWASIAPLGLENGRGLIVVMIISHVITPIFASLDYFFIGERTPLPMRGWLWFFAIPTVYVVSAIARGYAGGWVPYEYLDPDRGAGAIAGTVSWHGVILAALVVVVLRVRHLRAVPEPANRHAQRAQWESELPLDVDRAVA